MAIARLFQSGFESYYSGGPTISNIFWRWFDSDVYNNNIWTNNDANAATSEYYLSCYFQNWWRTEWSAAKTQLQVSFMFRTRYEFSSPLAFAPFMALSDSKDSNYGGAQLCANGQDIVARTNGVTRATWTDGMKSIRRNKWHHIAVDIKFHTTTGWFYMYFDGAEKIAYNGQTDHLIADASALFLCRADPTGPSFTNYLDYDDVYVNDSEGEGTPALPKNTKFHYVRPNGNGNYTQWTGSDGNTADNYVFVDDPHGANLDLGQGCIDTDTATNKDSWTMEDPALPAGVTIDAVIPVVICQNGGVGQDTIKLFTRYSGSDSLSSAMTTPLTYGLLFDRQTTKPGGGAWDATAVNAMEVGVEMQ